MLKLGHELGQGEAQAAPTMARHGFPMRRTDRPE